MIQRIQTIYFLLAAISFGVLFALPMASSDKVSSGFFADQIFTISDHMVLLGLTIAGVVLSLIAIFAYKNRSLQTKLGFVLIVLAVALPVMAIVFLTSGTTTMDTTSRVQHQPGLFVTAAAILFGILAIISIRKDERLVKSMDRLR